MSMTRILSSILFLSVLTSRSFAAPAPDITLYRVETTSPQTPVPTRLTIDVVETADEFTKFKQVDHETDFDQTLTLMYSGDYVANTETLHRGIAFHTCTITGPDAGGCVAVTDFSPLIDTTTTDHYTGTVVPYYTITEVAAAATPA